MRTKQRLLYELDKQLDRNRRNSEELSDLKQVIYPLLQSADLIVGTVDPTELTKLNDVMASRSMFLNPRIGIQNAVLAAAVADLRAHPWMPAHRFNKRRKRDQVVAVRELFYSRWLRIRWERNPIFWNPLSVRAHFGRLEIVLDPIAKKDWEQRDKKIKRRVTYQ